MPHWWFGQLGRWWLLAAQVGKLLNCTTVQEAISAAQFDWPVIERPFRHASESLRDLKNLKTSNKEWYT